MILLSLLSFSVETTVSLLARWGCTLARIGILRMNETGAGAMAPWSPPLRNDIVAPAPRRPVLASFEPGRTLEQACDRTRVYDA